MEKNGKEANAFFTKNKTVKEPKKLGVRKQSIKRADDFFLHKTENEEDKIQYNSKPIHKNHKNTFFKAVVLNLLSYVFCL